MKTEDQIFGERIAQLNKRPRNWGKIIKCGLILVFTTAAVIAAGVAIDGSKGTIVKAPTVKIEDK